MEPSEGLNDGGLVILVSSRIMTESSGINFGCSLRFLVLLYNYSKTDSDPYYKFLSLFN
jgi:hypothetical protein